MRAKRVMSKYDSNRLKGAALNEFTGSNGGKRRRATKATAMSTVLPLSSLPPQVIVIVYGGNCVASFKVCKP